MIHIYIYIYGIFPANDFQFGESDEWRKNEVATYSLQTSGRESEALAERFHDTPELKLLSDDWMACQVKTVLCAVMVSAAAADAVAATVWLL